LNQKKTRCIKTQQHNDQLSCVFNKESKNCNKKKTKQKKSNIYLTPSTKFVNIEQIYKNIVKQLDNTSLIIIRHINMFQGGVSDKIGFVKNNNLIKKIKEWKKTLLSVEEYDYTDEYKNILEIKAIYEEEDNEYWDEIIIYNQDDTFLKNIKQKL
jgi:hypothetical protein